MATTGPVSGHTDLGLDELLRLRVEPQLKQRLAELARRRRKPTAQMLREILWEIVEHDERFGGQEELPLGGAPVGARVKQ